MEAPEKVYISDSELNDSEHCVIWFKSQQNKNDIEYIRKDAFIEKACEWLYDNLHWADSSDFLEDFENYMKGE